MLKTLKKMKHWLYGVHFPLETDAAIFVAQLNGISIDFFEVLLIKWITWIRLFDLYVKHVFGIKHTAADGFSKRGATDEKRQTDLNEKKCRGFY